MPFQIVLWKWRNSLRKMKCRILELEKSLEVSVEQRAAERKGRIRAQQVHLSISVHLHALISVSASSSSF